MTGSRLSSLGTRPTFTAHRGESHDAPENTLAAFRLAWERGIKTVELDVRLSADRQLMVCHDADTLRTTGVRLVVAETDCGALQGLDAGSWKGRAWTGERIPTLDQALAELPSDCTYWIEIKSGPETAQPLAAALARADVQADRATVISFSDDALRAFSEIAPSYGTQLISGFRRTDDAWEPTLDELIGRGLALGVSALGVHFDGPWTEEACRHVHSAGLALCVWTVDDVELGNRLASLGMDAITSNRAAWLREAMFPIGRPQAPWGDKP